MLPVGQAGVNPISAAKRCIFLWERLSIDYNALSAWPGNRHG